MGKLQDGFKTTIVLGTTDVALVFETEVQPPGMEGMGGHDTSTMGNTLYGTSAPTTLIKMTSCSFTAAYDIEVYEELKNAINLNQLVTVTYPDTGTLAFYGFLNKFEPAALKPGEMPLAECEIIPTLQTGGVETAPVVTPAV